MALLALAWVAVGGPSRAEDTVGRLVYELQNARSFKVRAQAANLLARVQDARVVPALALALSSDKEEVVRTMVARFLGGNPGRDPQGLQARAALNRAATDRSAKVRRAAQSALVALQRTTTHNAQLASTLPTNTVRAAPAVAAGRMKIVVGQFADRSGQATPLLRERLRRQVMQQLQTQRRVIVVDRLEPDVAFVVEGSIRRLSLSPMRTDMEATCAVDLVLSRPTRGILLSATGEASVQRLRIGYKPQHRAAMEEEAMVHAVRSAHDSLAQYLARQ